MSHKKLATSGETHVDLKDKDKTRFPTSKINFSPEVEPKPDGNVLNTYKELVQGRQINLNPIVETEPPEIPVEQRTPRPQNTTQQEKEFEERLIRTTALLGAAAVSFGVGFITSFQDGSSAGQSNTGDSQGQGQAQADVQAQIQAQIDAQAQGNFQSSNNVQTQTNFQSEVLVQLLPSETAAVATTISVAAAAVSTLIISLVSESIRIKFPTSSFDRDTGIDPEPISYNESQIIVPYCEYNSYRTFRKELSDLNPIDNGLPINREAITLIRHINFCRVSPVVIC